MTRQSNHADAPTLEQRLFALLRVAGPAIVLVAASIVGIVFDLGTALLVVGFGILLACIFTAWASLRALGGEDGTSIEDVLALVAAARTGSAEKRNALLALRDLEQEREAGKLTDEDYAELERRFRDDAKRVLRETDTQLEPRRQAARRT